MDWIKAFFKPRQDNFVRLLIRQAEYTVEGMDANDDISPSRFAQKPH